MKHSIWFVQLILKCIILHPVHLKCFLEVHWSELKLALEDFHFPDEETEEYTVFTWAVCFRTVGFQGVSSGPEAHLLGTNFYWAPACHLLNSEFTIQLMYEPIQPLHGLMLMYPFTMLSSSIFVFSNIRYKLFVWSDIIAQFILLFQLKLLYCMVLSALKALRK